MALHVCIDFGHISLRLNVYFPCYIKNIRKKSQWNYEEDSKEILMGYYNILLDTIGCRVIVAKADFHIKCSTLPCCTWLSINYVRDYLSFGVLRLLTCYSNYLFNFHTRNFTMEGRWIHKSLKLSYVNNERPQTLFPT